MITLPSSPLSNDPTRNSELDLLVGLQKSPSYRTAAPGESDREELLLNKLGKRGWGRLHYFRQEFSDRWGEGKEKPFSPKSQEALFHFLEMIDWPEGILPSLFLTPDGHLELAWEDSKGKRVQLEFGPQQTELYMESEEKEVVLPNGSLSQLPAILNC